MKAKNNSSVRAAVAKFSYMLVFSTLLVVCAFVAFIKTTNVEVNKIASKTSEYDQLYIRQIRMAEKIDSIYVYSRLLNNDRQVNDILVYNILGSHRAQFAADAKEMSLNEGVIYQKFSAQMGTFLNIKDSVRIATSNEVLAREELNRCISDNQRLTQQISRLR